MNRDYETEGTGLVEVLHALRCDLTRAKQQGADAGRQLAFTIRDVEVELKFIAKKEGAAGIKFQFFNAGFKGNKEELHTIKLTMGMTDKKSPGKDVEVADDDAER